MQQTLSNLVVVLGALSLFVLVIGATLCVVQALIVDIINRIVK